MDKDLLACLTADFPDEFETACQPDSRDYLTIHGYRVSYEAGADPDILICCRHCNRGHGGSRRGPLRA